jgi:hypothetical protein
VVFGCEPSHEKTCATCRAMPHAAQQAERSTRTASAAEYTGDGRCVPIESLVRVLPSRAWSSTFQSRPTVPMCCRTPAGPCLRSLRMSSAWGQEASARMSHSPSSNSLRQVGAKSFTNLAATTVEVLGQFLARVDEIQVRFRARTIVPATLPWQGARR